MDARNSQNTRLSKKKGSCRRPIIYIYMSYYPLLYSRMTHYYYYYYYYYYVFNVFSLVELGTKLPQKPWTQELAKIPDCPRRKAVAEFRLCVGHDCLGTHLHRIGIRTDPHCMLCSLHETMDRNHLRRCTALYSGTECERYWEAGIKMMEN